MKSDLLEKKRADFRDILYELARTDCSLQSPNARSAMYQRLEKLYWAADDKDKFRHFYSDIYSVLYTIKKSDDMPNSDIEILGAKIDLLQKGYQPKNRDANNNIIDISDNINKLYDHVSLDIARFSTMDSIKVDLSNEDNIKSINAQIQTIKSQCEDINHLKETIIELEQRLAKSQSEYVTMLGIFASIVLVFFGGLSFSVAALQNLNAISVYRLIFLIDIIFLAVTNIIYMLLKFIWKINNKGYKIEKIFRIGLLNSFYITLAIIVTVVWCLKSLNVF